MKIDPVTRPFGPPWGGGGGGGGGAFYKNGADCKQVNFFLTIPILAHGQPKNILWLIPDIWQDTR